ncbi:MAG: class I SAM-dependent methyltransferase [Anaerolineaceae bacterium]|jgi:ubiquinone/menaquinone biosynthesis C-methylase UbiE|nr:class I SAM-dependent methyltransferase [Anaerolineaceae bacterium]MDD4043216.1 class I SAM-dependent methyltransferase [Anaerolineaceae bacterium]MDD4577540.1 class I SAM-dependent methyltransferase [Anaerolineaceae bacterium]
MSKVSEFNAKTWDQWSSEDMVWTVPFSAEQYARAKQRDIKLVLTPQKIAPLWWFEGLGKRVLGLASGGGQQGAELSAHGYEVTILDMSDRQLLADRLVAKREGYSINLIKADMTNRFPFADHAFDIIVHPVSNCYVEDIEHVWREAYRVLRPGGALMSGWTNPVMYMVDDAVLFTKGVPLEIKHALPYNSRLEEQKGVKITTDNGYQFSHTLDTQIGGQLRAGFLLKDFFEDSEEDNRLGKFCNLYAATLAIKPG